MNAISIAAVREFMAVQDRIRPALNCFSQEQHATDTGGRRGCWCWSFQTSPFHPSDRPTVHLVVESNRIEISKKNRLFWRTNGRLRVKTIVREKVKLSSEISEGRRKIWRKIRQITNHRFQLFGANSRGPRPVSSPPLSYLSNRVSPTQTRCLYGYITLLPCIPFEPPALPTSFYQETRGKGSNIGEAISTYRHRRWRSEHQVAKPVSLFPREFSRPERSLWFLILVLAVALERNNEKMLWLAIM